RVRRRGRVRGLPARRGAVAVAPPGATGRGRCRPGAARLVGDDRLGELVTSGHRARERREKMEQRELPRGGGGGGGTALVGGEGLDEARADLDGILAEADKILDNLRPINAEEYLQQNRQRGGE